MFWIEISLEYLEIGTIHYYLISNNTCYTNGGCKHVKVNFFACCVEKAQNDDIRRTGRNYTLNLFVIVCLFFQ